MMYTFLFNKDKSVFCDCRLHWHLVSVLWSLLSKDMLNLKMSSCRLFLWSLISLQEYLRLPQCHDVGVCLSFFVLDWNRYVLIWQLFMHISSLCVLGLCMWTCIVIFLCAVTVFVKHCFKHCKWNEELFVGQTIGQSYLRQWTKWTI